MKTSYGGRFVDSINGVASAPRRDWFYFVNGKLGEPQRSRGAAPRRRRRVVGLPALEQPSGGADAVSAVPAAALLAALALAALFAESLWAVAAITLVLLVGVPARAARTAAGALRRGGVLGGNGLRALAVAAATRARIRSSPGRSCRLLGELSVTSEELRLAALYALRFAAVGLASGAYVLLLDHDRLLGAASWARRSALAVALATRLVPMLERDARRSRRGAPRPRRRGAGRARARASALAAARRVARARAEPRRGDGGARLRPSRAARACRRLRGRGATGSRSRPRR